MVSRSSGCQIGEGGRRFNSPRGPACLSFPRIHFPWSDCNARSGLDFGLLVNRALGSGRGGSQSRVSCCLRHKANCRHSSSPHDPFPCLRRDRKQIPASCTRAKRLVSFPVTFPCSFEKKAYSSDSGSSCLSDRLLSKTMSSHFVRAAGMPRKR